MKTDEGKVMKCPKCYRDTLVEEEDATVRCRLCGNKLSPGQTVNYRLFKMINKEAKNKY